MLTSKQRSGINADHLFEGVAVKGWGFGKKGKRVVIFLDLQLLQLEGAQVSLPLDSKSNHTRLVQSCLAEIPPRCALPPFSKGGRGDLLTVSYEVYECLVV